MSIYKKSLHSFFLRVHPDFFARHPEWQRCNEQSIARLNELLDWARAVKQGQHRPPPATQISFKFYRRPEKQSSNNTIIIAKQDQQQQAAALPSQVTAQFELPRNVLSSLRTATSASPSSSAQSVASAQVERTVNKFLRDLLRKAGCLDNVAGAAASAQMADHQDDAATQERARRRQDAELKATEQARPRRKQQGSVQHGRRPTVETLMDAASDTIDEAMASSFSSPTSSMLAPPSIDDLISEDQVLFSRNLSPVQCASATQRLSQLLPHMRYHEWHYVPIIFTHRVNCYDVGRDIQGTMTLSWDFELNRFLQFLRRDGARIREARLRLQETAQRIEMVIADMCNRAELDDVLITCTHREALPFLEDVLAPRAEQLQLIGLTGITLEIGDHFATRDNGVVILDKSADWPAVLGALQAMERRLPELRVRYATAKNLLSEVQLCKERFMEDVRPGGVDCETSAAPYAQRLQWMRELARIGPQLAQYDWSDVSFALGPLSLDWEKQKVLSLPENFDGDNFIKYLNELQAQRKEELDEEYSEYEALRKHADAEGQSLSRHTREVAALLPADSQQQQQHDQPETTDRQHQHPASPRIVQQPSQRGGDDDDNNNNNSDSWREEYLTSTSASAFSPQTIRDRLKHGSAAASHHRDDESSELLTERPLYHGDTLKAMHTEQDATEQLEWEGFYESPYVRPAPERDTDELKSAFMVSNRKHRQEAVQKMIADLDEKYGLSASRFRQTTLGDRAGINDPQIPANRFPSVAKGTYAGDEPRKPAL